MNISGQSNQRGEGVGGGRGKIPNFKVLVVFCLTLGLPIPVWGITCYYYLLLYCSLPLSPFFFPPLPLSSTYRSAHTTG